MTVAPPLPVETFADLRIALFSGNYNYVRDGANQALNRLVGHMLGLGAKVRVYSPTTSTPAFPPTGDLVSVPSVAIPTRSEYKVGLGLPARLRDDLARFAPNLIHASAPDIIGHRAVSWARKRNLPVLASVHTRFETYLQYYHLGLLEPAMVAMLRRYYRRCDALVAPAQGFIDVLRAQGMHDDITIWSRGIDSDLFNPQRRDLSWRRSLGLGDEDVVIGFLGRLVLEKGLDTFSDSTATLRAQGVPHKVLVVGDGPAREWFEARLPGAVFTGFQTGPDLSRAVASMDLLFNPSVTEAFGNVTQEAMACGLPVVAAVATGSGNIVVDGVTGRLVATDAGPAAFAAALADYIADPAKRAAHGAAGEAIARTRSWDRINHAVAETYLRLAKARNPA